MAFGSIFTRNSIILGLLLTVFTINSYSLTTSLSNDAVCNSDFRSSVIKLRNGENSAILINDGGFFSDFTGRYPFNCKFVVKAKDGDDGVYVVIQELNFRENDNDCLDYVELSVPSGDFTKLLGFKNQKAKKFCGSMGPGMWLPASADLSDEEIVNLSDRVVAPNAYIAPAGEVAVEIVIARERLVDQKKLVISLAFTSYKKGCSESPKKSYLYCRIGECINSEFFANGIQNCPYQSCADEKGCKEFRRKTDDWPRTVAGTGIGTKVTFGAVGALVLILLKFGLILWLCKRLQRRRARQLPDFAAPIQVHPITSVDMPQPSAPTLEEIETKDLPPSYDSLYPEGPRNETHT